MGSHVTVLARPHVTHRPDGASAPQEGQDRDVKKVEVTLRQRDVSVLIRRHSENAFFLFKISLLSLLPFLRLWWRPFRPQLLPAVQMFQQGPLRWAEWAMPVPTHLDGPNL